MRENVPPPLPPSAQQESVASTLRALPKGARPSEVWRGAASSILRLNARECDALASVFEDEKSDEERRALVLDLLAAAGTSEAQSVMRRILSLAVARANGHAFASYVQRLGRVEVPDGQTLRFLMSVHAEARGGAQDVRAACAYALGAAAGQACVAGDVDAAVRATDVLRQDLRVATQVVEKCALLTALGNAGLPNDVATLFRFTPDVDATVRAAAALSLRKIDSPDVRAQLLTMLTDPERRVAQSAITALTEHELGGDDLGRLAELVLAGRTSLALDGRILRLLVAQRPRISRSAGRTREIENALRLLLGRVEAAVEATAQVGSGERRLSPPSEVPDSGARSTIPSPFPRATTVAAPLPYSGAYRMVPSAEDRDRMKALGLDVDARASNLPPPPKKYPSPPAVIRKR